MKMKKSSITHDDISKVAYDLYIKRGKIPGYSFKDWIEAEKILMQRHVKETEREVEISSSLKREKAKTKTKNQTD